MHHSFAQVFTLLMIFCMTCVAEEVLLAEVPTARSSACREYVALGGKVLSYRRNRVGEGTFPCETPSLSLISLLSYP